MDSLDDFTHRCLRATGLACSLTALLKARVFAGRGADRDTDGRRDRLSSRHSRA